jgi:hypothetical protein
MCDEKHFRLHLLLKDLQDKDRHTIGLLKVNDNATEIQVRPKNWCLIMNHGVIDPKIVFVLANKE